MTSAKDDPLRRALADSDPACPDGRALVRLGALVRSAGPGHADLAASVRARLTAGDTDAGSDAAIDAQYGGDDAATDPGLARLGALVAQVHPPRPVDLVAGVRRRLRSGASTRLPSAPATEGTRRWKVISLVVAGHLAAVLAFAFWRGGLHEDAAPEPHAAVVAATAATGLAGAPGEIRWSERAARRDDLLAIRRAPELLAAARVASGLGDGAPAAARLTAALIAATDADGHVGPAAVDADRDLAVQSLAALALTGEGLGDAKRSAAVRRTLAWIDRHREGSSPLAAALATAALVDGALLLRDPALRASAEAALAALVGLPVTTPDAAGLAGHALVALEVASFNQYTVPRRLLADLRRTAVRVPAQASTGRLGLAAWARIVQGQGARESTQTLLVQLAAQDPDPLAGIFAGYALADQPAVLTSPWMAGLARRINAAASSGALAQESLVPYATATGPAGQVFATAVLLNAYQAPTRYAALR